MFDRVLNTPLLVTIFSLPTETKVNVINVKQEGQPLVAGEKPITLLRFFFFFFRNISFRTSIARTLVWEITCGEEHILLSKVDGMNKCGWRSIMWLGWIVTGNLFVVLKYKLILYHIWKVLKLRLLYLSNSN